MKPRNKNSKQIKHINELKKPRDQQVAGLFLLTNFIAFPSAWRGGKNVVLELSVESTVKFSHVLVWLSVD